MATQNKIITNHVEANCGNCIYCKTSMLSDSNAIYKCYYIRDNVVTVSNSDFCSDGQWLVSDGDGGVECYRLDFIYEELMEEEMGEEE